MYCAVPVATLSVRAEKLTSTSCPLAPGRRATRVADAAGNEMVPRLPSTAKFAAVPESEYAPPIGAAPQPPAIEREKVSEAIAVAATSLYVAVRVVSAVGFTACVAAPPSDHDRNE